MDIPVADRIEVEEPALPETEWGVSSPDLPVADNPTVEEPTVADIGLDGTAPAMDVPEIDRPTVDETLDTETPTSGIGLPGIALGGAALAGAALPFLGSPHTQLRLTPGENQTVIANWDITPEDMDAVKQQGGEQFQLRVYDVTDIDIDTDPPNNVELFDCDESTDQIQVPVPQGDRNYSAAIGYVTADNRWLPLCRSNSVYIPASQTPRLGITPPSVEDIETPEVEPPTLVDTEWGMTPPSVEDIETPEVEPPTLVDTGLGITSPSVEEIETPEVEPPTLVDTGLGITSPSVEEIETPEVEDPTVVDEIPATDTPTSAIGLPGIALGGAAVAGAAIPFLGSPQTQLRLTPAEDQTVIADWNLSQDDMDAIKQQGGEQLQLRVYDITDIDIETDPPHSMQQYDCDKSTDQIQVSVPQGDRDYAAAIGYVTDEDQWLPICCSESIYVPAVDLTETETPTVEEPALADTRLGITSPDVTDTDHPEVEEAIIVEEAAETETDLGWSLSPTEITDSNLTETETPTVEEPALADTRLGITSPEVTDTETPIVKKSTTVNEAADTDTPTNGIGLPGMALGGAALAGAAIPFLDSPQTQLHLTPGDHQTVIADWHLSQGDIDAIKQQGGQQLQLRVYEVTDIEIETDQPHNIQQYDCDESTDQIQVSVPQGDGNYAAAIGYVTDEDQWLPICCSESIYVPAVDIAETETTEVEELTLADTRLGITSSEITDTDSPEIEAHPETEAESGWSLSPTDTTDSSLTNTETTEVEEPTLADTGLGITSSEITDTDSPEIEAHPETEADSGWSLSPTDTTDSSLTNTETTEVEELTLADTRLGITSSEITDTDSPEIEEPATVDETAETDLSPDASPTQLHLTPGDHQTVIADWHLSQGDIDAIKQQGGQQLQLRVYDVTDIEIETDPPHSMQQYDCDESTDQVQVAVPQAGCDYIAEIGYATENNQWLPLCRSDVIYIPAVLTDEAEEETVNIEPSTTGEALVESDPPIVSVVSPPPSQLNLAVIADQIVEASWEIPQTDIDAVKQQGGQQLQLRVYDVTDTDLHTQALDTIQQYDCDEASQELQVSIPQGDRNYAAAIGYVTREDEWLPLCCSDAVYVPALQPVEVEPTEGDEPSTPVNLTDVALGSAAAAASIGTIPESIEAEETPVETTPSGQILPGSCEIQDLTVHSRHHCFLLNTEQMTALQETAVSHSLEPGLYIVRIKSGTFGYGEADSCREPVVLLWIDGGKVINKKTNILVESTWSSLNGCDETLTLEVLETSTLCAFFFDTNPDDNYGEMTLSVIQLDP
jgi:hypothetical protein